MIRAGQVKAPVIKPRWPEFHSLAAGAQVEGQTDSCKLTSTHMLCRMVAYIYTTHEQTKQTSELSRREWVLFQTLTFLNTVVTRGQVFNTYTFGALKNQT